jgi:hypothetical protein
VSHAVADPRTHDVAHWNTSASVRFEHPDKEIAAAIAKQLRKLGCRAESHHFGVTVTFEDRRGDRCQAAIDAAAQLRQLLERLDITQDGMPWHPAWITVQA